VDAPTANVDQASKVTLRGDRLCRSAMTADRGESTH
jgi:hypothetical protein